MKKQVYNTTQLNPDTTMERHVYHRDQFAHYLRWTHVLNIAKIGMNILDVGCGSGNMYEVFYRNRYAPKLFVGIDIRKKTIEQNLIKFPKAVWKTFDPVIDDLSTIAPNSELHWDLITSFEVFEHIGKNNGNAFLNNIKKAMGEDTLFLMSTPCYDPQVGAADNHIINGEIGEYTYDELKELLESKFEIVEHYGTFASQKDYKKHMSTEEEFVWEELNKYYDSNLMSVIFAPLYPEYSRNVIWKLKLK